MTVEGCLVCDTTAGRVPPPGGVILESDHWVVDHTVGSLGLGTLIVKSRRHVLHVGDLDTAESAELGPLLQRVAAVVAEIAAPSQVYVCLWSHENRQPGHIHFVVQPVNAELMAELDVHGPALQVALFKRGETADAEDAAAFAGRARALLAQNS